MTQAVRQLGWYSGRESDFGSARLSLQSVAEDLCVKVEEAVLGSPSLIVFMVSLWT